MIVEILEEGDVLVGRACGALKGVYCKREREVSGVAEPRCCNAERSMGKVGERCLPIL